MPFKIYGLYHPTTGHLKYIGKTISPLGSRLSGHIYKAKSRRSNSLVSIWIRDLINSNKRPLIKLIEEYDDNFSWAHCEIKWINHYIKTGCDLLNVAEGGGGNHKKIILNKDIIEMMGKIPDTEIAERTGISRKTISNHRNNLGIPVCPTNKRRYNSYDKGKPAHNRHIFNQDLIDKMGKISDIEIAKLAGVNRKTVEKFRKRNNIKGYVPYGENHPMAKLSSKDVNKIIKLKGDYTINQIAEKFNTSYHTIWDILKGRSWKDG